MLFFTALFLIYLYFKLARVHKKEEKLTKLHYASHIIVAISALVIYIYAFSNLSIVLTIVTSFIFFIVAALMITAVQVGIFVDGKPFIGMSTLYKFMPILAALILLLTIFNLV